MSVVSRRGFLSGVGTLAALSTGFTGRVRASISFTVEYIRELENNAVASPDGYSYDAYEWNGNAVLEFEDSEYIEFGDENYPPATAVVEETSSGGGINFRSMQTGVSVFLVGVLGLLGGASAIFRNPAAGVMTALSFVLLIAAGLFGFGLELFWLGAILTALLLAVGIAVRWTR